MVNASLLPINCKSARKEKGVPVLHEILLKTSKSAGLVNTLPHLCQESSNPIKSKKENIINNNRIFTTAVLAPSLFFVIGDGFV